MNAKAVATVENEIECRECGGREWRIYVGSDPTALKYRRSIVVFVCWDCDALRYLDLLT